MAKAIFALIVVMILVTRLQPHKVEVPDESWKALNGAYRDGLYLGKLAARRGEEQHTAAGRWATQVDRNYFATGYEDGYRSGQ